MREPSENPKVGLQVRNGVRVQCQNSGNQDRRSGGMNQSMLRPMASSRRVEDFFCRLLEDSEWLIDPVSPRQDPERAWEAWLGCLLVCGKFDVPLVIPTPKIANQSFFFRLSAVNRPRNTCGEAFEYVQGVINISSFDCWPPY